MKLVNCTPHAVVIIKKGSVSFNPASRHWEGEPEVLREIPASGILPRCTQREESVGSVDGVEVVHMVFGEVQGLPEPAEGTYYIVSQMVATACKSRKDLLVPAGIVRDAEGRIIGCTAFATCAE